ncbi:hypothetical protein AB3S75_001138 [Citrus x aurantiifolia]
MGGLPGLWKMERSPRLQSLTFKDLSLGMGTPTWTSLVQLWLALDGGRSPAQPKIKIDQLSSSNQKVEHSILFKDGQNNLKGTGISDCYDTEEIISVSKVR